MHPFVLMRDTRVETIMTPNSAWIGPHETLQAAAQSMRGLNIGFLVVSEAPAGVVGVITDRDITVRATAQGRDPTTTEVHEAMTTNVVTCYDDEVIEDAAWRMERHAVRRLVVLDREGHLVGVLSVDDIARALGSERLAGQVLRETGELT